ncbi:MAG: c-type cytochrome [Herminiimonas sp.]|nr:c-type cytochrome [Herminiimonas sp.]
MKCIWKVLPVDRLPLLGVTCTRALARLSLAAVLTGLTACGGGSSTPPAVDAASAATPSVQAAITVSGLGKLIFRDASLSASGRLACASCHNPDRAHAQTNDLAAQLGGPDLATQGSRAAPSLRYLNLTPRFSLAADGTPSGGFDRDGRAQTLAEQAQRPFLAAHEMANDDPAAVIAKLQQAAYAEQFRAVFGASIFDDPATAFDRVLLALQQYQNQDPAFHPFDSKYDQFIAGKLVLDPAELRGLALFNNQAKGNCAACHTSAKGADGRPPLFTDFSFDNLGVPRNAALAVNADPAHFDLGLCGPDRTDLTARRDLCGAFKVPTLRNVATRHVFFHNGRFSNLRDVVGFYVRRDTNPEQWYPTAADGTVLKFDDMPPELRGNVNMTEGSYNRHPGDAPALSAAEIDDVVRFLATLTDGYRIP